MSPPGKSLRASLGGAILVFGLLPLLIYWPSFAHPSLGLSRVALQIGSMLQWLLTFTAFGVKPTYMLLSLAWIVWLWRARASDLVALRWGLIFFLAGEIACAVNYLAFGGLSAMTDYLHSFGMAVGFSFLTYALLDGTDLRLVKYSPVKDRCAALSLCRACIKYADVPCGLRRLFSFLIPALVLISLMLPCAALKPLSIQTTVLGSTQEFLTPRWSQLFEGHYCAWSSVALLLASWASLSFKKVEPVRTAKIFFAAAMGPLGFGLMRVFLRTAFAENLVWANIWEELTELIFVAGVGMVLWTFRSSLFRDEVPQAGEFDTIKASA